MSQRLGGWWRLWIAGSIAWTAVSAVALIPNWSSAGEWINPFRPDTLTIETVLSFPQSADSLLPNYVRAPGILSDADSTWLATFNSYFGPLQNGHPTATEAFVVNTNLHLPTEKIPAAIKAQARYAGAMNRHPHLAEWSRP